MTITNRQRDRHHLNLGSSDMAAILGASPYRSGLDVYLAKVQQAAPVVASQAMIAGTVFEDGLIEVALSGGDGIEALGRIDKRGGELRVKGTPILDHPDGVRLPQKEPVDAKVSGLFGPLPEGWGDSGTDQVPPDVYIQAQVHLAARPDAEHCHIVAFLGGRGFIWYHIPRHGGWIDTLKVEACRFWADHVEPQVPPDGVASMDTLKRLRRVPNKTVDISPDHMRAYAAARLDRLEAEKTEKAHLQQIISSMGDAEAGDAGDAGVMTYMETVRKGYTVKDSVYRTPRIKKPAKQLTKGPDQNDPITTD